MRCDRYEQGLTVGAAGGPIPPDLEAHLEGCGACRERLTEERARLGRVDQVLMAHLDVEPSPALRRRVIARVVEAERARRRMAPWAAAATLAAGLAMVVWAAGVTRRPSPTPLPSSAAAIVPTAPAGGVVTPETRALVPSIPRARVAVTPPVVRRVAFVREPEVLVPPRQEEALQRFVASLREGPAAARPLLGASASVENPIEPPPPIDIPLLASEPLAAGSEDPLERSES
jgi:hypothetical protein